MSEVAAGAAKDTEVEVVVVAVVMVVVSKEDVVEGAMIKTHKNLTAGTENLWQNLV